MAGYKDIIFRDFAGGLNTRDAPSEIAEHEFPYSLNVTIDERGYLLKRLGYVNRYSGAIGSGRVSNLFFWAAHNSLVAQIGTGLHIDGGGSVHTFTTNARIGICEFLGNLFIVHPVDGGFTYDGTTFTAVPTAPKGNTCATWQNRIWSNDSTASARLWKSDPGAVTFGGTSYIDVREKDSANIVLITGSSGLDIAGRPGLLVFKADSAYRVNDPTSAAYTTIDPSIGAGSNISGISIYGRTYVASTRGIYSTDGLAPMREESNLIENFFQASQLNQTRPDLYCVGRFADRLYFSFPKAGDSENSIMFELSPQEKWITLHSNAGSAYASGVNVTTMVFGDPHNNGLIYNSHSGGSDNGTAITSAWQSRWVEPNMGRKSRIRQARFTGYGDFTAKILSDYDDESFLKQYSVSIQSITGAIYDDPAAIYDDPDTLYSSPVHQDSQIFWSTGVCRAMAVRIDEVSTTTNPGRNVFSGPFIPETGGWQLSNTGFLALDLGLL